MVRFTLFGIPIEIQPWFWITLALIGGATSAADPQALLFLALFILAGFLSILVHELGHALTIKHFGAPTRITLQAFGGYATYPANLLTRRQEILVTAAGPAIQLVLGGIFFLILHFVPLPTPATRILVFYVFAVSLFWALLNLIPVIPLDGGRLMASFLGPQRTRLALQISIVCAIVGSIIVAVQFGGFLFPIFMGMMAYQNYQALQHFKR